MPRERVQRQIDRLLDEAEQAIAARDWARVRDCAQDALRFDPANEDALAFLAAAEREVAAPNPPTPFPRREGGARLAEASDSSLFAADGGEREEHESLPSGVAATVAATPAPTLMLPADLPSAFVGGRYQVRRFLGEGGAKRVFLAYDTQLDREVAFALIRPDRLDAAGLDRIRREAQAMGRLGVHPHIVTVYDLGEDAGQPYIVSQYMAGGDVAELLAVSAEHRLPLAQVLAIGADMCRALAFAHDHGVIHRDIKPANVWLNADGAAKLGDFGVAVALERTRLTQEPMIIGTAAYLSPEQAVGGEVTAQSDLYSLGALLYELVTGRPPFLGVDFLTVISQHISTPPVAPSWLTEHCPPDLDELILRLLAKDPAARPASAADVLAALERIDPTQRSAAHTGAGVNPLDRLARGVFVGRQPELGRLRQAFDEAFAGRGGVVLLVGEPGIGKTRAAQELETYARMRGAQVLWGQSHESSGAPAYWPWTQIGRAWAGANDPAQARELLGSSVAELVRLFPDLARLPGFPTPPPVTDPEAAQFALFDAYAQFIRAVAARTPLVLALDDLHWADKPSLLLLQHLARELARMRVLVVGTYRDTELARTHPLSEALVALNRGAGFTRFVLRGLSKAEVAAYIRATAGIEPSAALDRIYEETEGNPFFLSEVVNLLTQEGTLSKDSLSDIRVPDGVREALGRRLDRISPETNALLQVAAIIGREFTYDTLTLLGERDDDALLRQIEEAVRARVIEEMARPGRYRFTHALMQETLLAELSTTRRVRLHGQVAEALERRWSGRSDARAPRLAQHFMESATLTPRHAAKAVHYAKLAAAQAEAQFAWDEAVRHYEQVLTLISSAEDALGEDEAALLMALGRCARNDGSERVASRALLRAIDQYEARGDGVGMAQATLEAPPIVAPPERVARLAQAAVEALGDREPYLEAQLLAALLSFPLADQLDAAEEARARERLRDLIAAHGFDDVAATIALYDGFRATYRGDPTTGVRLHREAYPVFVRHGRLRDAAFALMGIALGLSCLGQLDEARTAAEEALAYARRHHFRYVEENSITHLADVLSLRCDWAAFDALVEEHAADAAWARAIERSRRALEAGDPVRAVALLPEPAGAFGVPDRSVAIHAWRARVLWEVGEEIQARREYDQMRAALPRSAYAEAFGGVAVSVFALAHLGDALPHLADAAFLAAAEQSVRAVAAAGTAATTYWGECVARQRAMVLLWRGHLDDAEQGLRAALAWCERERCPVEAGRCLQGLAEVAERRGQHAEARRLLEQASAVFEQQGARLYLRQVVT
jgi:tetratricopeptide (TPR) repeat protein